MYTNITETATTTPNRAKTKERAKRTPKANKTMWRRTAGGPRTVCTNIGHNRHLVSSKNKLWMRCVSAFWNRLTRKSRSKVGKWQLPVAEIKLALSHSVLNIVTHCKGFQLNNTLAKSGLSAVLCTFAGFRRVRLRRLLSNFCQITYLRANKSTDLCYFRHSSNKEIVVNYLTSHVLRSYQVNRSRYQFLTYSLPLKSTERLDQLQQRKKDEKFGQKLPAKMSCVKMK